MRSLKFLIPLFVALGIGWFLYAGLGNNPREIPSPLVGKAAPATAIALLNESDKSWSPEEMKGKVWMLNVWGSWCSGCQVEHPVLLDLARQNIAPIVGLAWKDRPQASRDWLTKLGDPYVLNVSDQTGKAAIDWGVYGAPETFVIDAQGVIRFKHVGALTDEVIRTRIVPLLEAGR